MQKEYSVNNNYSGTTLSVVLQIDEIYTLHYFEYNKNFHFVGETHDFWELVYVDSGILGITCGDKQMYLKQGECVFHKPNEFHNVWTDDNFSSTIIVSFSSSSPCIELFNDYVHTFTKKQRDLIHEILRIGKETYMGPLDVMEMEKLVHVPEISFGSEQMIKNLLEQLLIDVGRCKNKLQSFSAPQAITRSQYFPKADGGAPAPQQELIHSIFMILENNLCQRITLDDIASDLNFSKSYINNTFKRRTGYAIMQFHLKMKIEKAKELLSDEQYSITQISDCLGFDSIHSFSKAFRKSTTMAPSEYRVSVKNRSLL